MKFLAINSKEIFEKLVVGLTTIAIQISIVLLLVSTFIAIEKAPTKVQVISTAKKNSIQTPSGTIIQKNKFPIISTQKK